MDNKTKKKVVSLTKTKSSFIIHLPIKWIRESDLENQSQVILEYDGETITVKKL